MCRIAQKRVRGHVQGHFDGRLGCVGKFIRAAGTGIAPGYFGESEIECTAEMWCGADRPTHQRILSCGAQG